MPILFLPPNGLALAAEPELLSEDFGSFAVRPASVGLSGDGTLSLEGPGWKAPYADISPPGTSGRSTSFGTIDWLRYGGATTVGRGLIWIDSGVPTDAEGEFHRYSAGIEATGLNGFRYTRLAVRFAVDGVPINWHYALCEQGDAFFWGGCPGGSVLATIEYCRGPPVFVPGYVVGCRKRRQSVMQRCATDHPSPVGFANSVAAEDGCVGGTRWDAPPLWGKLPCLGFSRRGRSGRGACCALTPEGKELEIRGRLPPLACPNVLSVAAGAPSQARPRRCTRGSSRRADR